MFISRLVTFFPGLHTDVEKFFIRTPLFTGQLGRAAHVGVLVGPASVTNVIAPVPPTQLKNFLEFITWDKR